MQEKESLAPFLMLSLLAHILFLAGTFWFSSRYERTIPAGTDAIMIEFMGDISDPSPVVANPPPITKEPEPVEETPPPPVAEEPVEEDPVIIPDPKEDVVPEKPKEKAPVVVKRSKATERKKAPKKAPEEKADRDSVNAALAEMARDVANKESTGAATTSQGVRGNSGADRDVDNYRRQVASKVQQNWAHVGNGASDGSAILAFRVSRNGRLQFQSLKVQESTKGSELIESARRAILKSDPFPPFPAEIRDSEVIVLLRFTYKGVGL